VEAGLMKTNHSITEMEMLNFYFSIENNVLLR